MNLDMSFGTMNIHIGTVVVFVSGCLVVCHKIWEAEVSQDLNKSSVQLSVFIKHV